MLNSLLTLLEWKSFSCVSKQNTALILFEICILQQQVFSVLFHIVYLSFVNPVENESHCDFVKLREMLIRVNMEDLREQTHTRHYELYRRCKLEEMGFKDTDPDSQPFRWESFFSCFYLHNCLEAASSVEVLQVQLSITTHV